MARLRFEGVEKRYGEVVAVARLDLAVDEGEFLTLLGPSGCGKTTTLRMIAGFIRPSAGRLLIDDEDVTGVPPQKRSIGMVFQDYALFPHLTIAENIAFGLVERRMEKAAIARRVRELLDLVRLPAVGDRYPSEISGGQQQRIALARAVAHTPRLLLMDEPLGALDLKLRETMQIELRRIQQDLSITTVYVSHDQHEAMSMSDRIAVMNNGLVEQLDSPVAIYERPRSRFVADFVGKINFFAGELTTLGGRLSLITQQGPLKVPQAAHAASGSRATLAIRPEHLRILAAHDPSGSMNIVTGRIEAISFIGNLRLFVVRLAGDASILVETRAGDVEAPVGAEVRVGWLADRATLLADP